MRWAAAGLVVGLGFVSARFKWVEVCHDEITAAGAVVRACEAPALTDAVTIAWGASVLGLLAPDLAEASVGGLFVLKRRVDAQKAEIDGLTAHVANLQTTVRQSVDASSSATSHLNIVNVVGGTPVAVAGQAAPVPAGVASASPAVPDWQEAAAESNTLTARKLVQLLRKDLPGPLAGGRLHLYFPDDDTGLLMPVLEPPESPSGADGWRPGQGAVGRAWELCDVVTVHGDEVTAGLGAIDAERRARYAKSSAVIAAPLLNALGAPVGVVSVSTDRPGAPFDDAATDAIWEIAEVLARAVISLLGAATDQPPDGSPSGRGILHS